MVAVCFPHISCRRALLQCEEQGGTHCEVVLTYYSQCAAITQLAKGIFSSATAATRSRAESRVVTICGDERTCRFPYSPCALPVRVQWISTVNGRKHQMGHGMISNGCRAALLVVLLSPLAARAQCGAGIPGAGNPGCMPPTATGSPYHQAGDAPVVNAPPAVHWVGGWGAIAMDAENRGGTVEDRDTKSEAERIALDMCRRNGGSNCKVLATFNSQCAAMVQEAGGGAINGNTGATQERAERRALDGCKSGTTCHVIYSKCSVPHPVR